MISSISSENGQLVQMLSHLKIVIDCYNYFLKVTKLLHDKSLLSAVSVAFLDRTVKLVAFYNRFILFYQDSNSVMFLINRQL